MNLCKKILTFILPLLATVLSQSCVLENINNDEPKQGTDDEHTMLVLHIMKLDGAGKVVDETDNINEIVKDLRIIIINEKGEIESNDLITSDEFLSDGDSNELYYLFKVLEPGKRKFYMFANEGSVTDLEGTENVSLSSYLAGISVGSNASEFESVINSVWFKPSYKLDGNEIALPYSSFYELDMKAGLRYEQPIYLVPVATKICFNFFNNREYQVNVTGLGISSVADTNFLMGQPAKEEQTKIYNGEFLYWIDWLAKVSEESNKYPDFIPNVGFNEQNGWILNYNLPSAASHSEKKFIDADNEKDFIEIEGRKVVTGGSPIPGTKTLPYCYLPESSFFQSSKSLQQEYFLNINLEDRNPDVDKVEPVSVPLSNIKALFRNTRVIINVNFNEGTDEIYVEIRSWFSTDYFFGTVTNA